MLKWLDLLRLPLLLLLLLVLLLLRVGQEFSRHVSRAPIAWLLANNYCSTAIMVGSAAAARRPGPMPAVPPGPMPPAGAPGLGRPAPSPCPPHTSSGASSPPAGRNG